MYGQARASRSGRRHARYARVRTPPLGGYTPTRVVILMIRLNRAKLCAEGRVRAGARARGTRGGFRTATRAPATLQRSSCSGAWRRSRRLASRRPARGATARDSGSYTRLPCSSSPCERWCCVPEAPCGRVGGADERACYARQPLERLISVNLVRRRKLSWPVCRPSPALITKRG